MARDLNYDYSPDETEPTSLADSPWTPQSGPARFWLHALTWLLFYFTVVIAWGERNLWPDDLLICIALLPLNVLIIWTLYEVYGFGTYIDPIRGQQEQLIACLVLAVGIASGQLLLMNLGLVTLATAWLRPARPGVDWMEWLKVPLVLFTALPFWLDFQGSRSQLFTLFEDPGGNPVYRLPLALVTTQTRLLGYCGLLSLIMLLHGRVFWIAVPILPAFLIAVASLPKWFPAWNDLSPVYRQLAPWLLGALLLGGLSWLANILDAVCRSLFSGEILRRWFEERRYPPWLAVLVVAVAQTLPFDSVDKGRSLLFATTGVALMVLILVALRIRSGRGPVHSRSAAMVAGGLLLILLAEFSTSDNLRRLAMGFVLIGLISWHCFWRLRVFMTAGALSVVALAIPNNLAPSLVSPDVLFASRIVVASILLVGLFVFSLPAQPARGEIGYPEEAWIPSKRFALILLGLMMLFQSAGAFWPTHDMRRPLDLNRKALEDPHPKPNSGSASQIDTDTDDDAVTFPTLGASGIIQVSIAYPMRMPYFIESFERTLQRNGWTVLDRRQVSLPDGEAAAVKVVARNGQTATALWWFDQGKRCFSNHLYALRVLWSTWHLADRGLRQVRIESYSVTDPQTLVDFAAERNWFRDQERHSTASPR